MEHQANVAVIAHHRLDDARGTRRVDVELNARIALSELMQRRSHQVADKPFANGQGYLAGLHALIGLQRGNESFIEGATTFTILKQHLTYGSR